MAAHALVQISHIPFSLISLVSACVEGQDEALGKFHHRLGEFEYCACQLHEIRAVPPWELDMEEIWELYNGGQYLEAQEKLETLGRILHHGFVDDRGLGTIV